MNKLKKIYRDFFGLNEQTVAKKHNPADGGNVKITEDDDLDEATLDNSITEYQGGVQWIVTDPATAKHVMADISSWATKKGFTIIKRKISKSGKVGYIYFRMGEDPAKESQRIQGYVSQTPEIHRFRFKVLGQ
jgi:uncharacterized lipoprotein